MQDCFHNHHKKTMVAKQCYFSIEMQKTPNVWLWVLLLEPDFHRWIIVVEWNFVFAATGHKIKLENVLWSKPTKQTRRLFIWPSGFLERLLGTLGCALQNHTLHHTSHLTAATRAAEPRHGLTVLSTTQMPLITNISINEDVLTYPRHHISLEITETLKNMNRFLHEVAFFSFHLNAGI